MESTTNPKVHPFLYGAFYSVLWALSRPDISFAERTVLAALASRIDESGMCWPGLDRIAADIGGASRRTVIRAIQSLERAGLIAIVERSRGGPRQTHLYRVGGNGVRKSQLATVTSATDNGVRMSPEVPGRPNKQGSGRGRSYR